MSKPIRSNDPIRSTARLFREGGPFLGTCFAYKSPFYMVRADHCIGQFGGEPLVVVFDEGQNVVPVIAVMRHEVADIAVLKLEEQQERVSADFFKGTSRDFSMGLPIFAYGYPEIPLNGVSPRVFSGIFQQYLEHQSHMHRRGDPSAPRYRYVADELSIPCPGGLSGGPIFRSEQPDVVLAVVTENIDAMTLLEAIEQSQGEGTRLRTEYNRVITYGVGLLVAHVGDWLDRQIPGEKVQR
jgi:S1-C subfamily serine protease